MEVVRRAVPSRLTKRDCLLDTLMALVFGSVTLNAPARAHE